MIKNNGKEKPVKEKFFTEMKKIILYGKKYIFLILIAIVLSVSSAILAILGPFFLAKLVAVIVEGVKIGIDMDKIYYYTVLLIILYSLNFFFNFIQGYIGSTVTHKLAFRLRSDVSKKINLIPISILDAKPDGDILSAITNDIDTISTSLNMSITEVIRSVSLFVGTSIAMFILSYHLAFTAISVSLIGIFIMGLIIAKSQRFHVARQNSLAEINSHIEENFTAHNIVYTYNAYKKQKQEFSRLNKKYSANAWKAQFFSSLMMPLMTYIGTIAYISVSVLGAILVYKKIIGMELIVAFMIYVRLFTNPLSEIAQALNSLQMMSSASARVFNLLDTDEIKDDATINLNNKKIKGNVEFKDVSFGYEPDKKIIKNFSLKVNSGEKIAIVGPTGAGKTTLVNLLMRFYEIDSGEILIDDFNIKNTSLESLRNQFSMVLQDTWIFKGTISENIKYSNNEITDDDIKVACKNVGLDKYIEKLKHKYETVIDEKTSLSEGQLQLLTIARAMVSNSQILILDEATSSVDSRTEMLIQKAMDKLSKGKTSFVIAHRLSTIQNATKILVLNNGDIVEIGTHVELLAKKGFYHELYMSQYSQPTL